MSLLSSGSSAATTAAARAPRDDNTPAHVADILGLVAAHDLDDIALRPLHQHGLRVDIDIDHLAADDGFLGDAHRRRRRLRMRGASGQEQAGKRGQGSGWVAGLWR